MANLKQSDVYVVFTTMLCKLKPLTDVNIFAVLSSMSFKSNLETHNGRLDLSCEFEPYILPNTKIDATKDYRKNYMKVRFPRLPSFA